MLELIGDFDLLRKSRHQVLNPVNFDTTLFPIKTQKSSQLFFLAQSQKPSNFHKIPQKHQKYRKNTIFSHFSHFWNFSGITKNP